MNKIKTTDQSMIRAKKYLKKYIIKSSQEMSLTGIKSVMNMKIKKPGFTAKRI